MAGCMGNWLRKSRTRVGDSGGAGPSTPRVAGANLSTPTELSKKDIADIKDAIKNVNRELDVLHREQLMQGKNRETRRKELNKQKNELYSRLNGTTGSGGKLSSNFATDTALRDARDDAEHAANGTPPPAPLTDTQRQNNRRWITARKVAAAATGATDTAVEGAHVELHFT